jgi:hypothetical protein
LFNQDPDKELERREGSELPYGADVIYQDQDCGK